MPPSGGGEEQKGVGEGRKSAEDVSFTFHRFFLIFPQIHTIHVSFTFHRFFLIFPQIHPIYVRRQHGVGLTQFDRFILNVKLGV